MLNGLMKSKFYVKCKTAIKLTKTRIEIIMKKRNSVQKYLMGDLADLLKNRLDSKAYERAEGLCAETNLSACYAFVAKSCDFVDDSLSIMDKQRDCPEECKEAVSSLIFAAARFADLPELRHLRTAFIGRYENSLDANCSKEFVDKLKARTTEDMKLEILKYIALEYSIEWNSKPLERKLLLVNPLPFHQDPMKKIMDVDKRHAMDETILARRIKKEIVDSVKNKRETKDTNPDEPKPKKPQPGPSANGIELRKPLKPPPGRQNMRAVVVKGETSLRKDEEEQISRKKKLIKEKEEEESVMDRLLMHYSRKQSPYEQKEVEASLKHHHPVESRRRGNKHERSCSLPPKQMDSEKERVKSSGHARNGSLKQEMLSFSPAGNVHPNLPDYEDFIARLAAFKGN